MHYIQQTANISLLEKDPTDRPPRHVFELRAADMAKKYLHSAERDARAVLHVDGKETKELLELLGEVEARMQEMDNYIENVNKRIEKML